MMTTFADWCRSLRGDDCRGYFADRHGLKERSLQDLEQGRTLPSRSLVILLKAIEADPDWMRDIAKAAKPELDALDRLRGEQAGVRAARNKQTI